MRTIFFDVVPRTRLIVDQDDALAFDRGAVGRMLHAHAEFAHALGRLNEGAADIVVADDAEFERHAGMLAVAERGGHAGIRHRHHDIDLDMAFARELGAEGLADLVDRAAADDRSPAARNRCIRRCRAAAASAGTACGCWRHARRTPRSRRVRRRGHIWRRSCRARRSPTPGSDSRRGRRAPAGGCRAGRGRRSASCWSSTPAHRRPRWRAATR